MKKLLAVLTAIVAASMIFVGCGEKMGDKDIKASGTKWKRTIIADATSGPTDLKYKRGFAQLGDNETIAGITTTITIKKEDLTSNGKTGVVGLMFDFNKNASDPKNKRDYCLIGINMSGAVSGETPAYYVVRHDGVDYSKNASLTTDNDDMIDPEDSTTGTGKNLTGSNLNDYSKSAWVAMKDSMYKKANFDKGAKSTDEDEQDAYQLVVRVAPTLNESGAPDCEGYDVFIAKDMETLKAATKVATYEVADERKANTDSAPNTTKIKVGEINYYLPCGGTCMYVNAKTPKATESDTGTKIVAKFETNNPGGDGKQTTFTSLNNGEWKYKPLAGEEKTSDLVGDLKIVDEYDDIVVIE